MTSITDGERKTIWTDDVHPWVEFGFLAEDCENISTDLCFYKDEELKIGLDGIRKDSILAGLVKLIQLQKLEIDSLKSRIVVLESHH